MINYQKGYMALGNANPPPKYVIAEAKYSTSQLSNTKFGRQMSDDWTETRSRLVKAVGKEKAKEISREIILNPDNVQKQLVKITTDGNTINSILNNWGYTAKLYFASEKYIRLQ